MTTALHRCALCGEPCPHTSTAGYEIWTEHHHAVCSKRPIAVGDPVRWEYGPTGPFAKPIRWWPLGKQYHEQRYADGTLVNGHLTIEHLGPRWSTVHGNVGDRLYIEGRGQVASVDQPRGGQHDPDVRSAGRILQEPSGRGRPTGLKHGPNGSGCDGPCDPGCPKCAAFDPAARSLRVPPSAPALVDGLDVEYDGITLRGLLAEDERFRREVGGRAEATRHPGRHDWMTPAQRAAVSAQWSAALRAKVNASCEAKRNRVTYCEFDPCD